MVQCRDNLEVSADFVRTSCHIAQSMSFCIQVLGIETLTVVNDLESDAGAGRKEQNGKSRCLGMAKTVAHGFLGNVKQLSSLGGTQPIRSRGVHFQLELGWAVAACQSERFQRGFEFAPIEHFRLKTSQKTAYVAHGAVKGLDRRGQPRFRLLRGLAYNAPAIFQVQPHRVNRLNYIVMKIASNALAFLHRTTQLFLVLV